jgi:hypothetical protein
MKQISYSSIPPSKFPTLAEATWQEFSRFLSPYQWAIDDPSHSPRAIEIAKAIQNRGQRGACTSYPENGEKVVLRPLHAWAFEKALHNRKIFYVSFGKQALLYFDIDLHYAWQTKQTGQEAQELLTDLSPQLFWIESSRGFNGYLKVDLQGKQYHTANQVFERSQKALQLYLAYKGNLADFEIKGRIGYLRNGEYQWLPIHAESWNFPKLQEFQSKATVSLRSLNALCSQIEAHIPAEVLERHKQHKKSLGNAPMVKNERFLVTPAIEKALQEKHGECWRYLYLFGIDKEGATWLPLSCYRPDQVPLTESELEEEKNHERNHTQSDRPAMSNRGTLRHCTREQGESSHGVAESGTEDQRHDFPDLRAARTVAHRRNRYNLDTTDLMDEPDSFKRQKEALFRLSRYLKRVPTEEEALAFLQEKRLFSGDWEDNLTRRILRVRSIVRFIARTFDASKCAKGSVNVGKYDAWAKKNFPNGLRGRKRRALALDCTITERPGIRISSKFIAAFLSVCEFALLIDKNQDNTLPHKRAKGIWDSLYAKGLIAVPFCARKWATCRQEMVRYGIIQITNRHFGPGKAMEWALGPYFPFLGLWKREKQPSLQGPGCITQKKRRRREHNTLLHCQSAKSAEMAYVALCRPPP